MQILIQGRNTYRSRITYSDEGAATDDISYAASLKVADIAIFVESVCPSRSFGGHCGPSWLGVHSDIRAT